MNDGAGPCTWLTYNKQSGASGGLVTATIGVTGARLLAPVLTRLPHTAAALHGWCGKQTLEVRLTQPPVVLSSPHPHPHDPHLPLAGSILGSQGCQVYVEGQLQPRQWGFSIVESSSHHTILRLASDNRDEAEKWVRGLEKVGLPVKMGPPPASQRGSSRKQRRPETGEEGAGGSLLLVSC